MKQRIAGLIFDLKQNFYRGLYFNCWAIINRLSDVAEWAGRRTATAQKREDGYEGGERYPWRPRY